MYRPLSCGDPVLRYMKSAPPVFVVTRILLREASDYPSLTHLPFFILFFRACVLDAGRYGASSSSRSIPYVTRELCVAT